MQTIFKGSHVVDVEPLVAVHLDNPFWEAHEDAEDMEEDDKEDYGMRFEGEEEVGMIGITQRLEANCWKKAMWATTTHDKLVPNLIVDGARNTATAFRGQRKLKEGIVQQVCNQGDHRNL